ncbi:MAG: hypothetical protein IPF92_14230 [Myxococcales bacterium]|nr:hypothetical protein [Myxococcales bacterium]MBL0195035.1 hypothetical protein [Myxococcales bacterium]
MRKLLLIGLGIWLGGCVAETQETPDVAGSEQTDDSGESSSGSGLSTPGDRRLFVGNTAQSLTLEQQPIDTRPPPQPWAPPGPPTPGGDGPKPEPK